MKIKIGEIYHIIFKDHTMGLDELAECETFGRIIENNDDNIVVCYWKVFNDKLDNNNENITLIKSSIISCKKIR